MRGIVAAAKDFTFASLSEPIRERSDEVLIEVEWVSLNRGERDFPWQTGHAIGWDAFGHVVETSADEQGPPVGARVLTWSFAGAWAQRRVVSRRNLALVPDTVTGQQAAALPVAGLTALQTVRLADAREGARVAITGASGGVGHLAAQLAAEAGGQVLAVTRETSRLTRPASARGGDHFEVLSADQADRAGVLDTVIDNVGGRLLSSLSAAIRPGGKIILVGNVSGEQTALDTTDLISRRMDVLSVKDPTPAGQDLARLLALTAAGELRIDVADGGDWSALVPRTAVDRPTHAKTVYRVT